MLQYAAFLRHNHFACAPLTAVTAASQAPAFKSASEFVPTCFQGFIRLWPKWHKLDEAVTTSTVANFDQDHHGRLTPDVSVA